MTDLPRITCPYPSCRTEFIPIHKEQERCPACARVIVGNAPKKAIATADHERKRKKVKPKSVASPVGKKKGKPGPKTVLQERGCLTAQESLAQARKNMHEELDPLPWPTDVRPWTPDGVW